MTEDLPDNLVEGTAAYMHSKLGRLWSPVGGMPIQGIKFENDQVILEYSLKDDDKPEHCENDPHTTITFICPERGGVSIKSLFQLVKKCIYCSRRVMLYNGLLC